MPKKKMVGKCTNIITFLSVPVPGMASDEASDEESIYEEEAAAATIAAAKAAAAAAQEKGEVAFAAILARMEQAEQEQEQEREQEQEQEQVQEGGGGGGAAMDTGAESPGDGGEPDEAAAEQQKQTGKRIRPEMPNILKKRYVRR